MRAFLFDDRGEMWDAKSHKLADTLQASLSGEELMNYVIRNLGFVAVSDKQGSVRLSLRPAVVSQMAFSALLYWLHDRPVERVLMSFMEGEWSHVLVRSREEAVRRLMTRVRFGAEDRRGDFLHQVRPLQALSDSSPLRAVLSAWSDAAGIYDSERFLPLLQNTTNGRFFLVESQANSPSIVVKDVGTGFARQTGFWLSRAIGHRVEDQPDYAYGKWLAEVYGTVVKTREPSLDDVDAVITWPQQPRISYRYRRLVVPFETKSNSTLLLSATLIDPAINLRVKAD